MPVIVCVDGENLYVKILHTYIDTMIPLTYNLKLWCNYNRANEHMEEP